MTMRRRSAMFGSSTSARQRATRWAPAVVVGVVCGVMPVASAAPVSAPECSDRLASAMTVLPDESFAVCDDGSWRPVVPPFIPPDRWVSYGDGVLLHGQGRRNPEIMGGPWTGTPLDSSTVCGAEQASVTNAGVGAPEAVVGKAGETLPVEVGPVVFTITLTGDCLWERTDSSSS